MSATPKQIVSIQYLRALAVLGVVMFHACQWTETYFEIGAAGVDLFFIISGFIIWTVTSGPTTSPLTFLRRRAVRVAPLYWLATFAGLVVVAIHPEALPHVENHPLSHVILSLLFLPHPDPGGWPFPVLDVGWTLTYEAFFYALFAIALVLDEGERAWLVTLAMIGVALIGIAVPPLYLYGANLMLVEFAAGVWLARAYATGRLPRPSICWVLIIAGFGLMVWQYRLGYRPDLWRPLFWGVPSLAVAAGALGLERRRRLPRWPAVRVIGDSSYSIYLTHTLIAPLVPWILGYQRPWLVVAGVAALGVGGGLLVRRFVEKPMLRVMGVRPTILEGSAAP
jgi:exopolysaccharide production protein ExoZ